MLNKVMLIGNLGSDPEVRHLESGAAVAKFSIATNEKYKNKAGEYKTITEWHDIIMWRQLAELAERLLTKGKLVYIEGKLTTRKWQDQEGQSRKITEVVANNFQILEKREATGQGFSGVPNSMNEANATKPITAAGGVIQQVPATKEVPVAPQAAAPIVNPSTSVDDDMPF